MADKKNKQKRNRKSTESTDSGWDTKGMKKTQSGKGPRITVYLTAAVLIIMTIVSLSSCAFPFSGENNKTGGETSGTGRVDTGFVVTGPDSYDSADTAILVDRKEEENTVTFLNLELGRRYTLSMDGTTRLYDKYGSAVSIDQIVPGDIVDIKFLKSKKHLTTMQLSASAWVYNNVERYEMNSVRGEMSIGSEVYKLTSNTQYISEGRSIEMMDLNAVDVLSIQGIDNQILSVRVEKGHGYLRLENDEKFIGGWIEIGQSQIKRITEDMLLLVPEGSYKVNISHKGGGGIKNIVIRRNEETLLDIGDLEIPEPQTGRVLFSLSPADAELYVDGTKADVSGPITLEYGLHQIIARAEGYQSITQYIRVAQESEGFTIELDAVTGEEAESDSGSSQGESSSTTDTAANYYRVYVDAPEGVEVYLDGNYVGISPCSFRKTEGIHVITLRKSGYETRSYTVEVDGDEKDLSYSFAELTVYSSGGNAGSSGASGSSGSESSSATVTPPRPSGSGEATETSRPAETPQPPRTTESPKPTEPPQTEESPKPTEPPQTAESPKPTEQPRTTESPGPTEPSQSSGGGAEA